jgi:hypothetical protein
MKSRQSNLSRRNFLLTVGVGGATATVALVAGNNGDPQIKPEPTASDQQGYRLTEHIRNYYRTAKV